MKMILSAVVGIILYVIFIEIFKFNFYSYLAGGISFAIWNIIDDFVKSK